MYNSLSEAVHAVTRALTTSAESDESAVRDTVIDSVPTVNSNKSSLPIPYTPPVVVVAPVTAAVVLYLSPYNEVPSAARVVTISDEEELYPLSAPTIAPAARAVSTAELARIAATSAALVVALLFVIAPKSMSTPFKVEC